MINNRQGGRRRGRGGQQPRGIAGNNNSGNRQDNRQRGNAAQLLEKYKSMARDAQLAGDRVQTEYYLQFADHYFRMLGDARPRYDEQKRQRDDDDQDDDGDDSIDSDMDNDGDGDLDGDSDEQPQRGRSEEQPQRNSRPRANNDRAEPRRDRPNVDRGNSDRPEPRRERPNGRASSEGSRNRDDDRGSRDNIDDQRIDFAVLPPAIPSDDDDRAPIRSGADDADDSPKPRRRVRRPRADEGDVPAN
ncbi:MAG: DUF4167 domain-containing protein [Sphingomonas bacterium]|nr:DUF4167 domain-containing protein [Sphingomonas bacterium]